MGGSVEASYVSSDMLPLRQDLMERYRALRLWYLGPVSGDQATEGRGSGGCLGGDPVEKRRSRATGASVAGDTGAYG